MILPVIMCGGNGSRLWPLSRTTIPKQFLSLVSEHSMLQDTVLRLKDLDKQPPLFICNEQHRFLLAEQLRNVDIPYTDILLEPVGRNTAPAIALAALKALNEGNDPLLLVLAADHIITNVGQFLQAIRNAQHAAERGKLVTFGIVPTEPHTGYGYIRRGEEVHHAYKVDKFIEKPDKDKAEEFFSDGGYFWNSGMFLFRASRYLEELHQFRPDILDVCETAFAGMTIDLDFTRVDKLTFEKCSDESIDYAVMEKTQHSVVVPMDAGWNDLGSWSSLWDVNEKDMDGNAVRGDVMLQNTSNSYIYSQSRLVATIGIDDLVVVETKDAVLVAHKEQVQEVKDIVSKLKEQKRCEYLCHREVFRPWGWHDAIADGNRYHVKKVVIKPGCHTALQRHFHRTEHWVVVSGTAKVRNEDKTYIVSENESTYIPIGAAHSFENPGKIPLEVIEVRSGSYLDEDDIVRLDDDGVGY